MNKTTRLYEIDAALDYRNVAIIANYIKAKTRNAQFIIISLRNHMFEQADQAWGIFKTYDSSDNICMKNTETDEAAMRRERGAIQDEQVFWKDCLLGMLFVAGLGWGAI